MTDRIPLIRRHVESAASAVAVVKLATLSPPMTIGGLEQAERAIREARMALGALALYVAAERCDMEGEARRTEREHERIDRRSAAILAERAVLA